jgi:hypothetical protein
MPSSQQPVCTHTELRVRQLVMQTDGAERAAFRVQLVMQILSSALQRKGCAGAGCAAKA